MSKAKLQDIHGGNNNSIQWCIQCNRKFRSSWTFPLENMCFAPKKRHVEADTVGCQWLLGFCETSQLLLLYSYWYIRLYLQSVPPVVGCFFLSHMSLSTKKSRLIWVIINRYLSKRVPTCQKKLLPFPYQLVCILPYLSQTQHDSPCLVVILVPSKGGPHCCPDGVSWKPCHFFFTAGSPWPWPKIYSATG